MLDRLFNRNGRYSGICGIQYSIRWKYVGSRRYYSNAKKLLICADAGGSNGYRLRLWKRGCNDWRIREEWKSQSAIFHRDPANGTKLSIGCFLLSVSIGEESH